METIQKETKFLSQKTEITYEMEINAAAGAVFPLLCPTREYDWIPTWGCDLVYSETGYAEDMCVFTTDGHLYGKETWVCTRHEVPERVQYTRFISHLVMRLDIKLTISGAQRSSWSWTLSTVSLDETGNHIIKTMKDGSIVTTYQNLEKLLNKYLNP